MRIATGNLQSVKHLSTARRSEFIRIMAERKADIWILTETWIDFSPGDHGEIVGASSPATDTHEQPQRRWVTIWCDRALTAERIEVGTSNVDRMAVTRIKRRDRNDLIVVGIVLPWRSDSLFSGDEGFRTSLGGQSREWDDLLRAHQGCDFLVAGDFNQSLPHEDPYGTEANEIALREILSHRDIFCLTAGRHPTGIPRIDHICVRRSSLRPPYLPTVEDWDFPLISDHSGTLIEME